MNANEFLKSGQANQQESRSAVDFLHAKTLPELSNTPTGIMATLGRVPTAIREDYQAATEGDNFWPIETLGAILSPITGAARALAGEPAEMAVQDLGGSPNLARGIGKGATFAAESVAPFRGAVSLARGVGKAVRYAKGAAPAGRVESTAGAKAVAQGKLGLAGEVVSEKVSALGTSAKEFLRQVSRVGAKSVSYLDEPAKHSPTLAALREEIEHSDLPGKGTSQLDFNERTLLATGGFTKRFKEAYEPLKKDPDLVRDSLLAGAYDRKPQGDPWGAQVGKVRVLLDEVRRYANQAGLDLGYVKGYFPRIYDTDRLQKRAIGDAFVKKLGEHGIDAGDADIILRNMTDSDGIVTNAGAGRSTISRISPEMQRKLGDIPDGELTPFLRTNPEEAIPRYVSGVVRRAEYAKTFGANNEKLDLAKGKIIAESLQSERPIRADEIKRIDDLAQVLAGDYQRIQTPALRTTNDLITTYQYVRTLPLSVLSSLTEPFIALERGGAKAAVKAIPAMLDHMARQTIRTAFKGVPKAQATKDLEEIGLGLDETLAQVLSDQFSGGAATKAQSAFFKINLLSPWTRLTQVHAMRTAEHMIRDNVSSLFKSPNKRMTRELMELGVDIPRAQQWVINGARKDDPNYEAVKGGILRFVNETIMHPRGTAKPVAMSNPKLKLVMMLKGYHIMAGNTVVKRMLHKLVKGDAVEKARLAGALGSMLSVALLSDRIRDYIKYGDEGDPRKKNETDMEIFWRALNRTGLTGVFQFANDAVNASRFGSTGLQQLAGPAISQAQELVEGAKAASQGKPSKLQTETINALPFINVTPRTRNSAKDFLFGR